MNAVPVELGQFERVSDVLVLAAVERAERHRQRERKGVFLPDVVAHLGFVHSSWTTRRLRSQLDVLHSEGALLCSRRRGFVVWRLTSKGRQRLDVARRNGEVGQLPESPQHRKWRHARKAATVRIDGFREQMRTILEEASGLIDAERTPSDAWFEQRERLQRASWRLGSATYCLREWPEPEDAKADVDDCCDPGDQGLDLHSRRHRSVLRAGRRNTRRWDEREPSEASSR